MANYYEWLPEVTHISWAGAKAKKFIKSFALVQDSMVALLKFALFARFPDYAPVDAIEALGKERQQPRATAFGLEPLDSYRARVKNAWSLATKFGTLQGLIEPVAALGFTGFPYDKTGTVFVRVYPPHNVPGARKCGSSGTICGFGWVCGSGLRRWQLQNVFDVVSPYIGASVEKVYLRFYVSGAICGDGSICGDGTKCGTIVRKITVKQQ